MRAKLMLRSCVTLLLAGMMTAATAQGLLRPCTSLPPAEQEAARAIGACREIAPIVDVIPKGADAALPAVVVAVPNVVGLNFDAARERLAGFSLQRTYRASGEPGGTVVEQQPAPPTRVAAGATIRVVLSDGALRPAPRVTAAEVDGVRGAPASSAEVRPQPAIAAQDVPGRSAEPSAAATAPVAGPQTKAPAARVEAERLAVPNVLGLSAAKAQARLGRFDVERSNRPSDAPRGHVIEQIPRASARAAAGSAVMLVVSSGPARSGAAAVAAKPAETLETPDVVGRSSSDAIGALAEFKADRVEVVANAAPSGQVLAQNPAAGTPVVPGSRIVLQVSDGSLAAQAVATPQVTPAAPPVAAAVPPPADTAATPVAAAPAATASIPVAEAPAATVPVGPPNSAQSARVPVTFPKEAVLVLAAGALLGLAIGAALMRRRVLNRRVPRMVEAIAPVPLSGPPTDVESAVAAMPDVKTAVMAVPDVKTAVMAVPDVKTAVAVMPAVETAVAAMPDVTFVARIEAGETTIEFTAPPETDETAPEYSRELHE